MVKITRPQTFGEFYYLVGGLVHQAKSNLFQYLIRLRLWAKIFESAPIAMGITRSGQVVSTQGYMAGELPTQAEVDEFLIESGLSDVKRECFVWKKSYRDFEVWIGDTRDENFVLTTAGIVPIDIRAWFTESD